MDELIRELKSQGVLQSPFVAAAFRAVDRKNFVPPEYHAEAYGNYPLPIGRGQTISQPYTVAFMLDLLEPQPGEVILDVGAGSGWQTALLAHIVSQRPKDERRRPGAVVAVERIPELCALARQHLEPHGYFARGAVELVCGDGSQGAPGRAPFDKIIAAAAAAGGIPQAWRDQLKPGGAIVAPVDHAVVRYRKGADGTWQEELFPGFVFVPLVAMPREAPDAPRGRPRETPPGPWRRLAALGGLTITGGLLYATYAPQALPAAGLRLEIPAGAGSRAIGEHLKADHAIRSKWLFVAYAALTGRAKSLRAGTYELGATATIPELVRTLSGDGAYQNERTITVPEGWDLRDITLYFEANGIAASDDLWQITGPPAGAAASPATAALAASFDFLEDKPAHAGLEGYLFPDTYRIYSDATTEEVIRKMLETFGRRLTPDLRAAIEGRGETIFRVITMASLIEKEVASDQDRRLVAGILWRRLGAGIPLQVDASVNYATGKRRTPSAEDLAVGSPFNTYRHSGLPVGPIANPGLAAIRAAIFPEESSDLYYLSTPAGDTIFSRTLEEHAAAKARYLR